MRAIATILRNAGIALLLLASPAAADTIEVHGQRIRILDVDAPESRRPCIRPDGTDWRCGQKADLSRLRQLDWKVP